MRMHLMLQAAWARCCNLRGSVPTTRVGLEEGDGAMLVDEFSVTL